MPLPLNMTEGEQSHRLNMVGDAAWAHLFSEGKKAQELCLYGDAELEAASKALDAKRGTPEIMPYMLATEHIRGTEAKHDAMITLIHDEMFGNDEATHIMNQIGNDEIGMFDEQQELEVIAECQECAWPIYCDDGGCSNCGSTDY